VCHKQGRHSEQSEKSLFVADRKQSMIRRHNCDDELFKPPRSSAKSFAPKSTAHRLGVPNSLR
jgi:hypothetical protein